MDVPLGSAAYKVGRFEAGRFIEYDRVRTVGREAARRARPEQFRHHPPRVLPRPRRRLRAFKSRTYTFREEFTSRAWATQYDFPAAKDGRVVRARSPTRRRRARRAGFINTRREKFAHPKLREALGLAFDFEWTNKNVMFDTATGAPIPSSKTRRSWRPVRPSAEELRCWSPSAARWRTRSSASPMCLPCPTIGPGPHHAAPGDAALARGGLHAA